MKIQKEYEMPFSVERVYAAWISSDTVIPPATKMEVKPEVGGHYRLIINSLEFVGKNEGVFLRVEPDSRLTYTWEWNGDGDVSTIDVRFERNADGCHVTITHDGFTQLESMNSHDSGWDSYIEGLTAHLCKQVR
jgi:uncharacterized protein YndB with AHSA1/START domain